MVDHRCAAADRIAAAFEAERHAAVDHRQRLAAQRGDPGDVRCSTRNWRDPLDLDHRTHLNRWERDPALGDQT